MTDDKEVCIEIDDGIVSTWLNGLAMKIKSDKDLDPLKEDSDLVVKERIEHVEWVGGEYGDSVPQTFAQKYLCGNKKDMKELRRFADRSMRMLVGKHGESVMDKALGFLKSIDNAEEQDKMALTYPVDDSESPKTVKVK